MLPELSQITDDLDTAANFDGASDYIEVSDSPAMHSDRQLTIGGWFMVEQFDKTWQSIFWKGDPPPSTVGYANREYALFVNSAGFLTLNSTPVSRVDIGTYWLSSPSFIELGHWYYFATVIDADANYMRIYINGQLIANRTYDPSGIRDTTGPLGLGSIPSWFNSFNGRLDEVALYHVALTSEQIRGQYLVGTERPHVVTTVAGAGIQIEAGVDQETVEGVSVDLADASYTYSGDTANLSLTVNWGDGTVEPGTLVPGEGGGTIRDTHVYADNNEYLVTLTLSDGVGSPVADSLTVDVSNAVPLIDTKSEQNAFEGTSFDFSIGFSDDGSADTHVAVISWGDGSSDTIDPATSEVSLSHTYADNAAYTLGVTVTDDDGGEASRDVSVMVATVAPTALLSNEGPVNEGSTCPVKFTEQYDPSGPDTAAGFLYSYDFGDDGTFEIVDSPDDTATVPASYLDDGLGTCTVAARIKDKDGGFNEYTTDIQINNVAPTATLSNNGPIGEGLAGAVSFAGEYDPSTADTVAGFLYSYDFDNDGTFEIVASNQSSETVPADYLDDGPGTRTVRGRIEDKNGGFNDYWTDIGIFNVAPTAAILGPDYGVRGQARVFTLEASDRSTADQNSEFTFTVDWADGTEVQTIKTVSGVEIEHVFTEIGTYQVEITAEDKDHGLSEVTTHSITITAVAIQDDPLNEGGVLLAVGGTEADDHIVFNSGGNIQVILNGESYGPFDPTSRLLAFGQAGNDNIQVAGGIDLSAWLYGGTGDDRIKGGTGHDVILGGPGNDLLLGGSGRDILIGGYGADKIVGNADDDILISGGIRFDDMDVALHSIMAEWTSDRDCQIQVENISGITNGSDRLNGDYFLMMEQVGEFEPTVFDDGELDVLTGAAGLDWFFYNPDAEEDNDRATDLKDEVFAEDLAWILQV